VNTLEDRLRDAYRAAAETVRPDEIQEGAILSPPDFSRHRTRRTGQPRRGTARRRVLIPLAAAATVIAVAAAMAVLLPRAAPGLGGGKPASGQTGPVLLTTPAYFVELNWATHPSMYVASATTGTQGARISLPFPRTDLTAVATGDGQTFVVAATAPEGCSTTLYRFTLAANGTPSAMTPFTTIAGQIGDPWSMAVSAGARFIAYATLACGQQINSVAEQNNAKGYLAVLDTVTGQTRRWTFRNNLPGTGNVSISADGSVAGFANEVIDTSAPAGSLAAHARVVATIGEFGASVDLGGLNVAPDGKTVYFETNKVAANQFGNDKPVWTSHQLRAFDLATGQTRLVSSFPGTGGSPAAVTFDPTGRYMIVESVVRTGPTTELALVNVGTGQVTQLNAGWAVDPEIAW
jgi:hypothetical protein